MASPAIRSIFSAAARASVRPTRATQRLARRNMSASLHGSATSSDKPWIIVSALIFGPTLLYLLSPSSRRSTAAHAIHNDKHDFPGYVPKDETTSVAPSSNPVSAPKPVVTMKDDEGTEVNISESLEASEHDDVPKAGTALEKDFTYPSVSSTLNTAQTGADSSEGAKRSVSEPDVTGHEEVHESESGNVADNTQNNQQSAEGLVDADVASQATTDEKSPKE
ncbi:hypothetical protein AX17_006233 [Amanita inopinata Kibby_2008]|nr:hypothetical protein AX17_006233 [Amanita inopinata Kibby_2008]